MKLRHDNLSSRCISVAEYDTDNGTLGITFNGNSHKYEYENVPKDIFDSLIKAKSIGAFFNVHVKNMYNYNRVK